MKVILNRSYGAFEVSKDFCEYYNIPYDDWGRLIVPKEDIARTDARLIEYVENFGGNKASGWGSALNLFDVPAGKQYRIREHDGYEWLEYPEDIKWEVAD